MARSIVLTYERTSIFTMEVAGRDLTALAKSIGITRPELLKAINDEELDEYADEILTFIVDNDDEPNMTEEGDAASLEIEYIND
jgi:hypothetical protein